MGGAVPPLPQYAFMAWCSVRGVQGQLYFYLLTMLFHVQVLGVLSGKILRLGENVLGKSKL
jgi:hypothetical protein